MAFEPKDYPDLLKAIRDKNLVLFVGAGASIGLKNNKNETLGGWRMLVEKTLNYLCDSGADFSHLKALVGKCEPIDILNLLAKDKKMNVNQVYDYLKDEYFHLNENNDFDFHTKLYELSNIIITTNYDEAFEVANTSLRRNVAFKGRNFELARHNRGDKPLLFKLHGCITDPDSMVLFPVDYANLYESRHHDAEHVLWVLENLVFNKTILFIGCGMGDFQINNIFKGIKNILREYNQKHFIISKEKPDSQLDFLTQIPINDHKEIKEIIDELIKVKTEYENHKSSETLILEKQLAEITEANEKIENQLKETLSDTERKDLLLEKAANTFFERGLQLISENKLEEAIKEYELCTELNPNLSGAFNNWGLAIADLGKIKNDPDILKNSFEKYEKATQINPDDGDAFNNWGLAIADLGKIKNDPDILKNSFEKYEKATHVNPENAYAFNNWGLTIADLGKMKNDPDILKTSFEKFEKATQINPDDGDAFNNWGNAIADLGKIKNDPDILKNSFEKYEKATHVNPENAYAFNNWGLTIADLGKMKNDPSYFNLALEKFLKAKELNERCYNVSCAYALKKDKKNALKNLEISLKNKEIEVKYILEDKDWAAYLNDPDFKALIKKYT